MRGVTKIRFPLPDYPIWIGGLYIDIDGSQKILNVKQTSVTDTYVEYETDTPQLYKRSITLGYLVNNVMKLLYKPGLLVQLLFNEGSGMLVKDWSGNGLNCTLYGDVSWETLPNGAKYVRFGGVDGKGVISYNDLFSTDTDSYAIEAIFRVDDISAGGIFYRHDACALFFNAQGQILVVHRNPQDGEWYIDILAYYEVGKWYHVFVVYDSATQRRIGYINGVKVLVKDNIPPPWYTSKVDVWIGARYLPEQYGKCSIKLISFFNKEFLNWLNETGITLDDFVADRFKIAKKIVPEIE